MHKKLTAEQMMSQCKLEVDEMSKGIAILNQTLSQCMPVSTNIHLQKVLWTLIASTWMTEALSDGCLVRAEQKRDFAILMDQEIINNKMNILYAANARTNLWCRLQAKRLLLSELEQQTLAQKTKP